MSATLDWSWVFVMNATLYRQLRILIFSKIVPPSIHNIEYGGEVINNLTFGTLKTTVTVDTNQADALTITSPISGTVTSGDGNQDAFSGTVTLTVFLDNLFIAPCPSTDAPAEGRGATWTNCLNVTKGAFSAPTVDLNKGEDATAGYLAGFFQNQIDAYVSSSPNPLGTETSENLPQYFAPTFQKFVTLTGGSNDPRVLLLVMVNKQQPPTGDQHSAFESSSLLEIPSGANSVFAFDDYALYEYLAVRLKSKDHPGVTGVKVTQDPAVMTISVGRNRYTGSYQSQITKEAVQSTLTLSNALKARFVYQTTVAVVNNSDGTQALEFKHSLTSKSVNPNTDSVLYQIYLTLQSVSPLHGLIFQQIFGALVQRVRSWLFKEAEKLEFDKKRPLKGRVELLGITLNGGVVFYTNLSQLSGDGAADDRTPSWVVHTALPEPANPEDGLGRLAQDMDSLYDALGHEAGGEGNS